MKAWDASKTKFVSRGEDSWVLELSGSLRTDEEYRRAKSVVGEVMAAGEMVLERWTM